MRFYDILDDKLRYCGFKAAANESPAEEDKERHPVSHGISAAYALLQLREMGATTILGELNNIPNPYDQRNASEHRGRLRSDGTSSLEDKL